MKALRILVGVVVAVIVLIAVVIVLALTPAVQTWAVHRAVADMPGMKIDVGHVSAGLSSADLRDVHFAKDGMVVTASGVTARYSAMDYLLHHRVTVDDLAVEGLVVDTRGTAANSANVASSMATTDRPAAAKKPAEPEAQAKTPAPSQPFSGVLNGITLPVDLNITRFDVPGRALLPNDQTATFDVRGSNLITGQRGTVEWKADVENTAPNSPYRAAHTHGTAAIHLTNDRHVDLLDVDGTANAEGQKLPAQDINIVAKAARQSSGNESYNAAISLVRGQASEPLITLTGEYAAAAKEITGNWTLSVKSENVAELLSGFGLPDVSADGSGKFTAHPDSGASSATGQIQATLAHPEKISAGLASVGSLHTAVDFAGAVENNVASIEKLTLTATTADGHKLAEIQTLQRVGYALADKKITFANASAPLARVAVTDLPLAWAQPFAKPLEIQSGQASMVLAVAAEPDGSRVHVTSTEPLSLRDVTVRNGNQTLADRLTLTVKPQAEYSADHLHAELNELNVTVPAGDTVTGRFTADIANLSKQPAIAFTTDTQAKFVALLKPYLNVDTGPLTVVTKSDGSLSGDVMHFEHSSTRITRDNGDALVSLELQQPMTLNVQTKAVTVPKPDAETLRVTLGQVPLNWAQSFVSGSKFDGQLAGGVISVVVHSLNDVAANTATPVALHGVSVSMSNQPTLQNVDLTIDFSGAKHGEAVTFDVRKVEARTASATLLSVKASGDISLGAKPTINAKGNINADLTALMQQPVYGGTPALAHGTLDGSFDAKITDTIQANGKITAKDLVAKEGNRNLGDAEVTLTAAVQPDGSSVLKIPFTLTNGSRKSDVLVDGKLGRSANTVTFDGSITSNRLIVDDLQPLAGLAPAGKQTTAKNATEVERAVPARSTQRQQASGTSIPTPPNQPAGTAGSTAVSSAARDTQPFWTGFGGHVAVDLKRIDYGANYAITAVHGNAVIDPKQLSVPSLDGSFNGNPFKLAATISFNDQQPKPYTLNATTDVNNFDVGAFLKASNPSQPPQLETKVTVTAKLNGTGATLADLAQNAYGNFDVNGSPGVVRGLGGRAGEVAGGAGKALAIANAFGLKQSDRADAVAQVIGKLSEFRFDKFTMHAERGADLNIKVGRIEFVSPDARVTGSGGIQNQPGVPVTKQPLQFTFQLGAKQDMAVLLNTIHMLGQQQDDQGYYLMTRTYTLKGSIENHDSDLKSILLQAGLNTVLPGVLNLLGR